MDGVMTGSDMRCLAIALTMSLVATAHAADPGHHGAGMGSHGPMRSDDSSTVAPVMTSPAATAAPTAPSTAPASNLATRGPSDLYARRVPAGAIRESDAQWQHVASNASTRTRSRWFRHIATRQAALDQAPIGTRQSDTRPHVRPHNRES
jgi:hypothetical protein